MLQINNNLRALTEAKHSLNQIMESATDFPALYRMNNGITVSVRGRGQGYWVQ
jgi:hypothetical protein